MVWQKRGAARRVVGPPVNGQLASHVIETCPVCGQAEKDRPMGAVRKVANYLGLGAASHFEAYSDEGADDGQEYDDDYEDGDVQSASDRAAKRWQPSDEPAQIVMVQPRRYEDAPVLGRHFRAGRAIVMDVSGMTTPEATRMVD